MSSLQIIKSLQETTSRDKKEQILIGAYMEGERDFFMLARLALNPMVTFGVKKAPTRGEDNDGAETFGFSDFLRLTDQLRARTLTGHAARDAIHAAAAACDWETWNSVYKPVLLKDLRCGVERSTFNKVITFCAKRYPEAANLLIPVFGVQLAKDGADASQAKKLVGKKLIDFKLDGMRLATICDKDAQTVTQWSRSGHQIDDFPQLCQMLVQLLPELPCSIVLDGEVVSDTFQKLMTQVRRKTKVDTSDAKLALFDLIPLPDFLAGVCQIDQEARHDTLCELELSGLLLHVAATSIYVLPKKEIDLDTEEGQAELHVFKSEAARLGFEGVMVKDPRAGYLGKRSEAWLKIKPTFTVDLTVIAVEEGTNKLVGRMGALVCEGQHDGKHVVSKVGTGFSDADRAAIWDDREKIIGQIVEIETDALTQSRDSVTWSLRFPGFKRFRSVERIPGEKD